MSTDQQAELKSKIQAIADKEKAVILSFIAPDTIVRLSPVSYSSASIRIQDLYSIENKLREIKSKYNQPLDRLFLVIHTPGGEVYATTKIAKYLRSIFKKEIIAFVPYEAASGGTHLCLGANSIVMDELSNLTPIDPQIFYRGERVSANSYKQVIDEFEKRFEKLSQAEIPVPYQHLCNQFDPVISYEFSKKTKEALLSAFVLLQSHMKDTDKAAKIAVNLANTSYTHSHVIDKEEAINDIGLQISQDEDKIKMLDTFRQWIQGFLDNEETKHIVEYFIPNIIEKDEEPKEQNKKEDSATKKQ